MIVLNRSFLPGRYPYRVHGFDPTLLIGQKREQGIYQIAGGHSGGILKDRAYLDLRNVSGRIT